MYDWKKCWVFHRMPIEIWAIILVLGIFCLTCG